MVISETKETFDHSEFVKLEPVGKNSTLVVPFEPNKSVLNLLTPSKPP